MSRPRRSMIDRFWENVVKTSPDECWEWNGLISGGKYGQICVGGRCGRMVSAHRVSYELHHGEIPDGLFVLHGCDNKLCVNPDHLHLGTHQNNMDEGKDRDRFAKGQTVTTSKLTEEDVISLRDSRASGVKLKTLASEYGISVTQVFNIASGKHWKHLEMTCR